MPYTAQWKDKGYYVTYTGVVTSDEVMQATYEMGSDPRFDDLRYVISNYLLVQDLEFDVDKITGIIRKNAKINAAASLSNPNIKRAVVSVDETVIAFANLYVAESKAEETAWELKVFSSLKEAEQWVKR